MSNVIYDANNPFPASGALTDIDLVVIDLDVTGADGAAIKAANTDHILLRKSRTVTGQTIGLELVGTSHMLVNEGTIKAGGVAVRGSASSERIVNTGTLQTTSGAVDAIVVDLGDGHDVYDGLAGHAIGGTIKLGGGNDTALGGIGAETFSGGTGDDILFGGAGDDTADYSDATGNVRVDLNKTLSQLIGGEQGSDVLIDIENVRGGAHNDMLIGSAGHNALHGGDGQDSIIGGDGNDTLGGGDGNDTLEGGQGNDTLDGGSGVNTARYSGTAGARVDLARTDGQITVGYGVDVLIGIAHLEGGSGADQFTGSSAANRLAGNEGNDVLAGREGNDTLEGGAGNDTLEGGAGNDTLDGGTGAGNMAVFSGQEAEYTITKSGDTVTIEHSGGSKADGTDTLKNLRLVKFSDKTIALTNGNPTGFDLYPSGMSEDKAVGTALGSFYATDPDGDALTYSIVSNPGDFFGLNNTGNGLVLKKKLDHETAAKHTITIKVQDAYGGALTKSFTISVYNVVETTPLVRTGTSKGEQLVGESGNDNLSGMAGNDQLFGQIGNDTLTGGNGNDALVGGAGKDAFRFDYAPNVKTNVDYIQDFNPTDDILHLSQKAFSKIAKGALSSKAFVIGDHFKDKDDRILYYKQGGSLFYDPDGSGSAKAIQFASIAKNLAISHKDFYIL